MNVPAVSVRAEHAREPIPTAVHAACKRKRLQRVLPTHVYLLEVGTRGGLLEAMSIAEDGKRFLNELLSRRPATAADASCSIEFAKLYFLTGKRIKFPQNNRVPRSEEAT